MLLAVRQTYCYWMRSPSVRVWNPDRTVLVKVRIHNSIRKTFFLQLSAANPWRCTPRNKLRGFVVVLLRHRIQSPSLDDALCVRHPPPHKRAISRHSLCLLRGLRTLTKISPLKFCRRHCVAPPSHTTDQNVDDAGAKHLVLSCAKSCLSLTNGNGGERTSNRAGENRKALSVFQQKSSTKYLCEGTTSIQVAHS